MKNLLAVFCLAPFALLAQENTNYDPDYNGDGCYTATDLLGLLPLFGSCGFACGDPIFFDNYWYETVLISDQCWFAENLRTTVYADSTSIPEVTGNFAWVGLSTGARCDYENNAFLADTYGRLYNWYAVDDVRGLCPSGWHVPTHDDWIDLLNYIASQGFVGINVGPALQSNTGWTGTRHRVTQVPSLLPLLLGLPPELRPDWRLQPDSWGVCVWCHNTANMAH